jgi:hypothetical protein
MNRAGFKAMKASRGGAPLRDLAEAQRSALLKVTGRGKYGSKRCTVDGEAFDSKLEAKRWLQLKDMQRRGLISGLLRQVEYPIHIGGMHVCSYFADFVYVDSTGREVVEDCKAKSGATMTQVYRLKKRLVLACHGVVIVEHFA